MSKLAFAGAKVMAALPAALSTGADTALDISSIMGDAVKTTQGQIMSTLAVVVPAIVAITAAVVGVKFGISWLRRIRG